MRHFLLCLFIISGGFCLAQPTASSLKKLGNSGGKTWAVVIGISDYQDKDIPDLRFAHRDAEAFALWLQSPAGGNLDGDQLQVLINDKATAGRVAEALDALLERVQEDDKVFIYFSGHGDVERKTLSQPGFLLCWDAPSRVYMGGGTYSLAYLQEVVATLSLQNKAKVTVIADACRAGKLAGSQIGGPQLTSANLQRQQANEMKILSCQSQEYSIEGTQWGGGRGVFSYHLMDGLYGLADRNGDGVVTLGELDRYLEDHVTAQAAPISQVPVLLGNKTDGIATIHEKTLADLHRIKSGEMVYLAATDSRGLEDEVLAKLDSGIVKQFLAFKEAVREKRFFPDTMSANAKLSADELYTLLISEPRLSSLYGAMTRNYAAALQDEAQQTLNSWLKMKENISRPLHHKAYFEKVRSYPRCLNRAAELLGEQHYMFEALKARKYFFEGYLMSNTLQYRNKERGEQSLAMFRLSLEWLPEQPHVYWQMSKVFGWNLLEPDSLEYYAWLAMEVHPNWTKPCYDAAYLLSNSYLKHDRAKLFLEEANRINSDSPEVLDLWAAVLLGEKNYEEAERKLKKGITLDSTYLSFWMHLGYVYKNTQRLTDAEIAFKKAIEIDSTYAFAWMDLGNLYRRTGRDNEAETAFKRAIEQDTTFSSPWHNLGYLYSETGRYAEAEQYYKKAIELDSTGVTRVVTWVLLGNMYNHIKRYDEGEHVFKKIIAIDSTYKFAWNSLGHLYFLTQPYAEAEPVLLKAIALDSLFPHAHKHLGMVYFKTNRTEEARQYFQKALMLKPNYANAYLSMAFLSIEAFARTDIHSSAKAVLKEEAIAYVEQAIANGSTFDELGKEEDLAPLRALKEWKVLMQKHFPDQGDN